VGLDAAAATIFGDDDGGDAEARPAQFGEPLAAMGSGMPLTPVPATAPHSPSAGNPNPITLTLTQRWVQG